MKMFKVILLMVVVSVYSNPLSSQDMLVDGASWFYTNWQWGNSGTYFNYFEITGDSLINGKSCKVIKRDLLTCDFRKQFEYVYKDVDGKFFYYEETQDSFQLLYDYGAEVGETITVNYWPNFLHNSPDPEGLDFQITVDSISHLAYGDSTLKEFMLLTVVTELALSMK